MINKESFKLVTVVLLLFCCTHVESIKFFIQIPGMQRSCFYEVLSQSQKYSIQLAPSNQVKYQLQISQSDEGSWKNVYYRMTNIGYERIQVHKLALSSTTYSFCIKNIQNDLLRISIKFKTGVQLMQFQLLPDKSDTQNLDRQISWIESQKKSLYDTIRHIEQKKTNNINASSLLSTKMILFAILGLFSIVVVNFLFFKEVKKTFKQRKLV